MIKAANVSVFIKEIRKIRVLRLKWNVKLPNSRKVIPNDNYLKIQSKPHIRFATKKERGMVVVKNKMIFNEKSEN